MNDDDNNNNKYKCATTREREKLNEASRNL